ncbi:MAG: ParB N-terminal domain-containing protein [Treponema sp.]|nr:ParB N-terminal domain-containing protein [Treponema sp.]
MPKMGTNQIAVKIPLSQIVETGNVRTDYSNEYIEQLATSILKTGLLQPVVVKRGGIDENGLQEYELIAGHCRKRAFELLCKQGYDYTSIDACVKTGDKRIIQLIENVQRSDLTATEKENALKEMVAAGYTQTQISEELSKPLSWVSDILHGDKVRQIVEAAGVDTTGIATKTLSQVRSIPVDELPAAVEQIKENGGTVRAATEVLHQWREKMPEQMPQNGLVKKIMAENKSLDNAETTAKSSNYAKMWKNAEENFDWEKAETVVTLGDIIAEIASIRQNCFYDSPNTERPQIAVCNFIIHKLAKNHNALKTVVE